jgi:hypothetical protein
MNISVHHKHGSFMPRAIFTTLFVLVSVYCMFILSTSNKGSMLKYQIPVSTVDTGYHPSFKVIKSW